MSSSPLSVLRKSKRNQWGRSHGSWGTSRSLRCLPTCSAPRDRCPSPGPTPVKCTRALSSPRAFWPRACGRRSLLCSLGHLSHLQLSFLLGTCLVYFHPFQYIPFSSLLHLRPFHLPSFQLDQMYSMHLHSGRSKGASFKIPNK